MRTLGRILGNVLAVLLVVLSMQATAETQLAGRDFNHDVTGFPLTGGHATAACETCHVAGVFKGTPKNCDGCHALGRRVVATPKSTSHIVTDAPCEICHFNNFTFQGARYNHGTALPGQCVSCHNGRITTGRPTNHNAGLMLTGSCDNCHRSYAFLPASWNHTGVAIGAHTCNQAGCHLSGGGNANRYTAATAGSPVNHSSYVDTSTKSCDVCHISFVVWSSTMHEPITGTCSSCHLNGAAAQGQPANHSSFSGWPTECSQCHTSTVTWLNALGAMPSNHIPYNNVTATCSTCHPAGLTNGNGILHNYVVVSPCTTCHLSTASYLSAVIQKKSSGHTNGKDCTAGGCHAMQYNRWNNP